MIFKNGIFKTRLFTKVRDARYTINIECVSKYQKELLIPLYDFIRNQKSDNIQIAIREFLSLVNLNLDLDEFRFQGCKISINAMNNTENLYVPVI